jgi:dTDP-4-amino-4,6-dideoxygalactose transaminase
VILRLNPRHSPVVLALHFHGPTMPSQASRTVVTPVQPPAPLAGAVGPATLDQRPMPAAFDEPLHVGRPNIGDRSRLLARINTMLDSRRLTNRGPFVREFETRLEEFCQVEHAIAMCNGTIALEIAIRALGLSGEVIVPSFTFVATAHALQWQEITPVFCDIDPVTCTIDPKQIERLITPRTTGIIGVHLWGRACHVDAIDAVARAHGLKVLYDAAHALGSSYRGRVIGSFGHAEVLSFHATKFVNAFEGGAVLTNDDALAAKIRLMQNFGFSGLDQVSYIGTNGKMAEISAVMGITSLESVDEFVAVNRRHFEQYRAGLRDLPGLRLLEYDTREHNNYQYVIVEVDEAAAGLSRDELVSALQQMNVLCRRYFHPGCHRMEPYRSYFPNAGLLLPVTESRTETLFSLPTGTAVDDADIARVIDLMSYFIDQASRGGSAARGAALQG